MSENSKLTENALAVAVSRYFMEGETWEDCATRVGTEVGRVENGNALKYIEEFSEMIYNMDFLPGGRILRNTRRARGSLFNCYVLPLGDSIEEIGQFVKDSLILWSEGGGVGVNYSSLRPRGAPIKGKGGNSSGPVSFLEASDAVAKTIESGGSRRAAAMGLMHVSHPDILEFIDVKLTHDKLKHYNLSVAVDDDFLEAVESDNDWHFKFAQQDYGKIKARDIWTKVIDNMVSSAEPGLLNWKNLTSNNSYYFDPILSTNPCVVGSTLIAVADGRNAVSIKQLTDEGVDVPIYSTNVSTGKVEIKLGKNPRKTGVKKEVWKLTLDDGSVFVATPDHKVLTKDLNYVELKDLNVGESVFPFNSFNSNNYRQICNVGAEMIGGARRNRRQYRLIYEYNYGEVDSKEFAIHHKDFDSFDDSFGNLESIPHDEHMLIHSERMLGLNNPYHKMSNEWKNKFASHPGKSNGRYSGFTNDELIDIGRVLYKKFNKFTRKIWQKFAKKYGYPQNISNGFRFGNFTNFKNIVINNHKVVSVEFCGYEDVYNITVGDNNNYHVITYSEDDKFINSTGLCVKNCGEVPLGSYGVCNLGSIVLPNFIRGQVTTNWKKLEHVLRAAVRFLDNVIEINKYVLKDIDINAHNGRRIGIGMMGLAEYLFAKKLRYGSKEAIYEIERVMRFIRDTVYDESIQLSVEKGAFPKFDPVQYGKSHFIRTLPASVRMSIKKSGIRNVTLMAIAPTGTISLLPEVTSGIEPLPYKAYKRVDRVSDRIYVHPMYKPMLDGELGDEAKEWYVDTTDLSATDHFETQSIIQKYVDGALSKTINLQKGTTAEELSDITLEYIYDLKGVTVYVDGSRKNQPLTAATKKEVKDYLKNNKELIDETPTEIECAVGSCET